MIDFCVPGWHEGGTSINSSISSPSHKHALPRSATHVFSSSTSDLILCPLLASLTTDSLHIWAALHLPDYVDSPASHVNVHIRSPSRHLTSAFSSSSHLPTISPYIFQHSILPVSSITMLSWFRQLARSTTKVQTAVPSIAANV